MATIENFATVSYTSGGIAATKVSNLAEIQLDSSLSFSKTTLGSTYSADTPITYILSLTNSSTAPIQGIRITDDLGTFAPTTTEYTPLTYVSPALLLINGQDASASLTVDTSVAGELTFSFPTLPTGATANIVYNATPNSFAPLESGGSITNTAIAVSDTDCASGEATTTVRVLESADIEVVKSMCPNPVVCGDTVNYTIRVYNYGNLPAENVVLSDTFSPAPTSITVSRNGVVLPDTEYTFVDGTLTVPPTATAGDTIPAATFVRDPVTGKVTVTPAVIEYVISGII